MASTEQLYRIIVELSHMSNNNEIVFFDTKPWSHEDVEQSKAIRLLGSTFDRPTLALCRLVTPEEIKLGLDITYQGKELEGPAPPEATELLDGLTKLLDYVSFRVNELNCSAADAVISYIGTFAYDCMSGGCDNYSLSACRQLIRKYNIPLDSEVYPRTPTEDDPSEFHTVEDFLRAIESIPELPNLMLECKLPPQLIENFGD